MNVIILTEGGKDYGFGHVARCSSIYQAFRKFCITPQFIVNGDKSIDAILQNIDYNSLLFLYKDHRTQDVSLAGDNSLLQFPGLFLKNQFHSYLQIFSYIKHHVALHL